MTFNDVEQARQVCKQKAKKIIWITLCVVAIFYVILLIYDGTIRDLSLGRAIFGLFILLFPAAIVILMFVSLFTRKQVINYRKTFKSYFVEKNLTATFSDLKYNHEAGLPRDVLRSTEMIHTGDHYYSNDLTTGKYKDVAFTQADVHIQVESTDSDGNTTYTTIFKGRFMIFEFPKKFNFRLEVVEKRFGASKVPSKNKTTGRKFEKITVESDEFNKIFKTYAEDGFEAFYILDPAFINNILELDTQYDGKLFLGFLENKLIVGLSDNKDAFEPPHNFFKPLDEATENTKISKDIHLITNFIDKLKLDRKLFKND